MPGYFLLTLVVIVLAAPDVHAAAKDHRVSEPITPTETIKLFNGKDLSGWTTWLVDSREKDPKKVYSIRNNMIRISGDGFGYLSTKHAYRDYRLVVEFRWGNKNWGKRKKAARDSGIFLHSVGPDGNSNDGHGAFKAAIECQVMQGAVGDFLLIKGRDYEGRNVPVRLSLKAADKKDADGWPFWNSGGKRLTLNGTGRINWFNKSHQWKDVLDFRGKQDIESAGSKWTRVECTCQCAIIETRVNGVLVNRAYDVLPSSGKILLQCEGSEVFFRKVELHPILNK